MEIIMMVRQIEVEGIVKKGKPKTLRKQLKSSWSNFLEDGAEGYG